MSTSTAAAALPQHTQQLQSQSGKVGGGHRHGGHKDTQRAPTQTQDSQAATNDTLAIAGLDLTA